MVEKKKKQMKSHRLKRTSEEKRGGERERKHITWIKRKKMKEEEIFEVGFT